MGSGGLQGPSWTLPDTFWSLLAHSFFSSYKQFNGQFNKRACNITAAEAVDQEFNRQYNRQLYKNKTDFEKVAFRIKYKKNNSIKGFPGLLNTLGTLLDRSQTIKHFSKDVKKWRVPWAPWALGPKTITSLKIIESHENLVLLQNETDARRNFSKVWFLQ